MKIKVAKRAPNWLYALAKGLYLLILRRSDFVMLIPCSKYWLACGKGKLFIPSPKGDWLSFIIRPDRAHHINEGDVVVEVGACLGATVLSLAHKAGKVIAIEPDEENFKFLRLNVRAGGYDNVIIVNKAVWSSKCRLRFYTTTTVTGHTLTPSAFSPLHKPFTGRQAYVEADTLDNILAELNTKRVDVLLMNIEGAEVEALKGAEETLKRVRKLGIVCHNEDIKEQVVAFLKNRGFIVHIEGDVVHAERPMTLTLT